MQFTLFTNFSKDMKTSKRSFTNANRQGKYAFNYNLISILALKRIKYTSHAYEIKSTYASNN